MAHNPHAPNPQAPDAHAGQPSPEGYDPAGSTQMFQAFVDEEPPARQQQGGGNRNVLFGVIAVVAVSLVALVAVALL